MTFLRRHWPDLVIVLLILALVAGFAVVLLGGRGDQAEGAHQNPPAQESSAPAKPEATASPRTSPATPSAEPEADIPKAPAQAAPTPSADSRADDAEELPTIAAAPQQDTPSTGTEGATATPREPSTRGQDAPVTQNGTNTRVDEQPAADAAPTETAPAAATTDEAPAAAATDTAGSPTNEATDVTEAQTTQPAAQGAPAVPASEARTPTRADYRLSAGVFSDEAGARERTRAIAALGYTVHVIPIDGGRVVAQIGPFADRDTASRAREDINRVFGGVTLYAPVVKTTGDAEPATPATPTTPDVSSPSSGTAARSDERTPATPAPPTSRANEAPARAVPATPSPSGSTSADVPDVPVYLQVGAFDRQESAAAFVEQLRAQGFDATVNAPPGRKVRVLVGPFGGNALLDREARLRALGVDSFRVR